LSAVVEDLNLSRNDREEGKREGKMTRARGRKPLSSGLHYLRLTYFERPDISCGVVDTNIDEGAEEI